MVDCCGGLAGENEGLISGSSSGALLYCYNQEAVGTKNNGYNVGGIAGTWAGKYAGRTTGSDGE